MTFLKKTTPPTILNFKCGEENFHAIHQIQSVNLPPYIIMTPSMAICGMDGFKIRK